MIDLWNMKTEEETETEMRRIQVDATRMNASEMNRGILFETLKETRSSRDLAQIYAPRSLHHCRHVSPHSLERVGELTSRLCPLCALCRRVHESRYEAREDGGHRGERHSVAKEDHSGRCDRELIQSSDHPAPPVSSSAVGMRRSRTKRWWRRSCAHTRRSCTR